MSNIQHTRPDFYVGVHKKRNVATQIISYEKDREILFQKVASGYLLHFVQDGSSKDVLETDVAQTCKQQNINLQTKQNDQHPLTPFKGPYLPLRRDLFPPEPRRSGRSPLAHRALHTPRFFPHPVWPRTRLPCMRHQHHAKLIHRAVLGQEQQVEAGVGHRQPVASGRGVERRSII